MTAPAIFTMRLPVEEGKVAEFCRAVGLTEDEGAEYAPPTFTAVMDHFGATIAEMMASLGYPAGRVLHGEESIEYPHGPLAVGQSLTGEARHLGTNQVEARSGPLELVRFAVELVDQHGETVVRIARTLVVLPETSKSIGEAGAA